MGEAVRGASAKTDDATNLNFPPLFIFRGLKLQIFLTCLHPNGSNTARTCEQLLRERLHTKTGRRECAGARHKSLLWLSQRRVAWAKQGNQRNRHGHSAITRMTYVTRRSSRCPRDQQEATTRRFCTYCDALQATTILGPWRPSLVHSITGLGVLECGCATDKVVSEHIIQVWC